MVLYGKPKENTDNFGLLDFQWRSSCKGQPRSCTGNPRRIQTISDCWTFNGEVLVKDNRGLVRETQGEYRQFRTVGLSMEKFL